MTKEIFGNCYSEGPGTPIVVTGEQGEKILAAWAKRTPAQKRKDRNTERRFRRHMNRTYQGEISDLLARINDAINEGADYLSRSDELSPKSQEKFRYAKVRLLGDVAGAVELLVAQSADFNSFAEFCEEIEHERKVRTNNVEVSALLAKALGG